MPTTCADNVQANAENTADAGPQPKASRRLSTQFDNSADADGNKRSTNRALDSAHSHAGGSAKGRLREGAPFSHRNAVRHQKLSGTTSRTPGSRRSCRDDARRDRVVDCDQRDRLAACLAAAEVEGRDVDAGSRRAWCRARR